MRIISSFRDYYDSVQATGQDQSLVYIRKTQVIEPFKNYPFRDNGFTSYTIGFCGEIYLGFSALFTHGDQSWESWCYDIEACDRFMEQLPEPYRDSYYHKPPRRNSWRYGNSNHKRASLLRQFQEFPQRNSFRLKEFHKYKAPAIVWGTCSTIINPCLREFEFYRVKDPYTAFQEISQFIGGVLGSSGKEIPQMTDEDMQQIKGFDHPYSFRKPPKGE